MTLISTMPSLKLTSSYIPYYSVMYMSRAIKTSTALSTYCHVKPYLILSVISVAPYATEIP